MSTAAIRRMPYPSALVRGFSPAALLLFALLAAACLLLLPLRVPIGPMLWDVFIYYDAANRIFDGQVPSIDFFAPVGPLGYYLFAFTLKLFPNGNPALLAHWSLLWLSAPLMLVVCVSIGRTSRATAFALLIPFLLFALLPFNSREFYPFPGSDAFGIYNRQVCQILYVLVASLTFVRNWRALATVVFAAMTAIFFLKITGFVAALPICGLALLSRRLPLAAALAALLGFVAVLGGLEAATGVVSHYLADVEALVARNTGTLAPRLLMGASQTFGVTACAGALVLFALWTDRRWTAEAAGPSGRRRGLDGATRFLSHDALWLAVTVAAGVLLESQNTGSQAMIFCWPPILLIAQRAMEDAERPVPLLVTLGLAAAASLPPAVSVLDRAARTYVGAVSNVPLPSANLKSLGAVNIRPLLLQRAERMLALHAAHPDQAERVAALGELTTPLLFSDLDFQATYLMATDRAITAIHALEAAKGIRFETIMSLNFVNPVPWLMDRSAPKHIAIGADPYRAMPDISPEIAQAVRDADLVVLPKCPLEKPNIDLLNLYAPMLTEHRRIALDACTDGFVHQKFFAALD